MEPTKIKYVLEAHNVTQAYDGRVIISDINLKVRPGEFVSIVGPTGCGKSTFFRTVLGSERPVGGKILVEGKEITQPDRDRGIVFQKYSLFPDKTVKQNVMFGLELEYYTLLGVALQKLTRGFYKHSKQKEFEDMAEEYLNKVGLWSSKDNYAYELSGGMSQRVAIAQTLIMKPKIVLMDEPLGALDSATRESMQVFILEQCRDAKSTVLFVTHDLNEAVYLGTRLVVISPYYQKEQGMQGSKIVKDANLPWTHPRPTSIKGSSEFAQLVENIRKEGLNPQHLQAIKDFDLTHEDAQRIL